MCGMKVHVHLRRHCRGGHGRRPAGAVGAYLCRLLLCGGGGRGLDAGKQVHRLQVEQHLVEGLMVGGQDDAADLGIFVGTGRNAAVPGGQPGLTAAFCHQAPLLVADLGRTVGAGQDFGGAYIDQGQQHRDRLLTALATKAQPQSTQPGRAATTGTEVAATGIRVLRDDVRNQHVIGSGHLPATEIGTTLQVAARGQLTLGLGGGEARATVEHGPAFGFVDEAAQHARRHRQAIAGPQGLAVIGFVDAQGPFRAHAHRQCHFALVDFLDLLFVQGLGFRAFCGPPTDARCQQIGQ